MTATKEIQLITETPYEKWRADTLYTKEPGTVAWIQRECKPGDVFYDVGANIGQYTLMAAQLVMPGGSVVAFEPHLFNAASLLRNLAANNVQGVRLMTTALHDREDVLAFYYKDLMAGSSGSQLGHTIGETGEAFEPKASELKLTTTIDLLVTQGVLPAPVLIKIDVDGNERRVLGGIALQLLSTGPLRSVQIEVHPTSHRDVTEFMAEAGWQEAETHHTAFGQAEIDKGTDPAKVFRNVIYKRI